MTMLPVPLTRLTNPFATLGPDEVASFGLAVLLSTLVSYATNGFSKYLIA